MKRILLFILCVVFIGKANASEPVQVVEPDFIGEALVLLSDQSTKPLEKSTVQLKTKANAGVYIVGMGSIKTKINVDGAASRVRLNSEEGFQLIVRANDNNTDPMSIISIFKFKPTKKVRRAELSSVGTFSGASQNNLDLLSFQAKKYGESSYLITLDGELKEGEYGITVRNPNALDERHLIVACFGID